MTKMEEPVGRLSHKEWVVSVGGADLEFQSVNLNDRKVDATQILRAAGYIPTLSYRLVELTYPGTRSWDADEVITLKKGERRDFIVGELDRIMTFAIDDIVYEVPFVALPEASLRQLAAISDATILTLQRVNEPDQILNENSIVNFDGKEVERLFTSDANVTICLDGKQTIEIPKGKYKTQELIALLGVNTGYVLSYVDEFGQLKPLADEDSVCVFEGMKVFSHAAGGGAS
jgi:hypothetical protein